MKPLGRLGVVPIAGGEYVEGVGQQRREVVMVDADANSPIHAARLPCAARFASLQTNFERQINSQTVDSHATVFGLAAAFGRLPLHATGAVREHNRRFNLVAMLAARTGAALPALDALRQ